MRYLASGNLLQVRILCGTGKVQRRLRAHKYETNLGLGADGREIDSMVVLRQPPELFLQFIVLLSLLVSPGVNQIDRG